MKPAIRVENLSKSYCLGTRASGSYRMLRETINDSVAGAWHGLRRRFGGSGNGTANGHAKDDAFWALKDVSFEVQPGEVVGIIGRNGAGKSTLLKILSRIVEPTAGRCEVRGRMASLLEVGTGFHPELTGRENIYMNGSILGMSRKEIDRNFDEIVDFAEIEQFLDTPVKRYSSGMYVRLAFAVAAHLEPEILVVDEVLAVGDAQFQQKCLGKMNSLAQSGRTILFVSHNLTAVNALSNRAIALQRGRIACEGRVAQCIANYLTDLGSYRRNTTDRKGGVYGIDKVRICNRESPGEDSVRSLTVPGSYFLELAVTLPPSKNVNLGFTVVNEAEIPVVSGCIRDSLKEVPCGRIFVNVDFPVSRFPSGNYRIEAAIWEPGHIYDKADALAIFSVINTRSTLDCSGEKPRGATLIDTPWYVERMESSVDTA